jgi:hypothetical protein
MNFLKNFFGSDNGNNSLEHRIALLAEKNLSQKTRLFFWLPNQEKIFLPQTSIKGWLTGKNEPKNAGHVSIELPEYYVEKYRQDGKPFIALNMFPDKLGNKTQKRRYFSYTPTEKYYCLSDEISKRGVYDYLIEMPGLLLPPMLDILARIEDPSQGPLTPIKKGYILANFVETKFNESIQDNMREKNIDF